MTITGERLNEIAATAVAASVDDLASDRLALYEILGDEDGIDDLSEDEQKALADRLETAIRAHKPVLAMVLEAGQPFNDGTGIVPGYVAGECGHRVAQSEWKAGFRRCERC